jgi:hypothetical protein
VDVEFRNDTDCTLRADEKLFQVETCIVFVDF